MKISEFCIKNLAKAVCGDCGYTRYIKGYEIVEYFNKYGINDVYQQGFPSRWKYTEEKIRQLNDTDAIKQVIEDLGDPKHYFGLNITIENAIVQLNEFLKFDKLILRLSGDKYILENKNGAVIQAVTTKEINHDFIQEQIEKCNRKILEGDCNGAITNARSLLEAIFIEIIEKHEATEIKNDGDIINLWSRVKKIMKLEILPDNVIQILSGIDTTLKGFAGLSNNAGDRHANKFKTKEHHAKLAVNLAMTLADFLFESLRYQKELKKIEF